MEDSRFDSLSRLVGGGLSRRSAVRLAVAAIVGGSTLAADHASANRRTCRVGGRQCTRHGQCCTGDCMRVSGGGRPRLICRCERGLQLCGTRCVDLDNDPRNCGACGKRCKAGQTCCDGACVELGTKDNCGSCGDRCLGDASCIDGECLSVCVEGPGVDACCDNKPTRLGTDTDCDDCGDSCAGFGSCYEHSRGTDGSFNGAVCCDCTDRCGTYCDGACGTCASGSTCDLGTNTCSSGYCSLVPDANAYYVTTDSPPQYLKNTLTEDASAWWYNTPVSISLIHECTQSSDCTANCPASINHPEGYAADGCFCARSKCDGPGNGNGGDLSGSNPNMAAAGGQAGKYYCWLHLKKP